MSSIFTWTDLYQELADKVLSFKNDRTAFVKLVEKSYKDANLEYKLYWGGEDGYSKKLNHKEEKIGLKLPIPVTEISDYDAEAPFLI